VGLVGEAWIEIRAKGTSFDRDVQEIGDQNAERMGEEGEASGKDFGEGVRTGAKGDLDKLASDAETAGSEFGGNLRKGAAQDLEGLGGDAEKAGEDAGRKLESGSSGILGKIGTMFSGAFGKARSAVESAAGAIDSNLSGIMSKAGGLENVLGPLAGSFESAASSMEAAGTEAEGAGGKMAVAGSETEAAGAKAELTGQKTSAVGGLFQKLGMGVAVAGLAFSAASVKMAVDFTTSTRKIAASAGISVTAAKKIGTAFLSTAGTTVYGAGQMETAYGQVAAQLGSAQGKALSASQALQVMTAAGDLAEASGVSLTAATAALGTTMQAYGLSAKQAATASSVLFQAARATNTSVTGLSSTLQRLKSGLGAMAPSLATTSALMLDLANHGESGRRALSTLQQATTALLKPLTTANVAQKEATGLLAQLNPSLQGLAQGYLSGSVNAAELSKASKDLTSTQAALLGQFKTYATQSIKANALTKELGLTVTTSSGQFVGWSSIIDQLKPKLAGMTQSQQLATLAQVFGQKTASALLDTISAGPAAFDKYSASVHNADVVHQAAEKNAGSLKEQMEKLKTTVEDDATKWGTILLPALEKVLGVLLKVFGFIMDHKPILIALGVVVGGILVASFYAWAASLFAAGGALEFLAGPIGLIVLAIAAIGIAVYELYTHWTTVWSAIKQAAEVVWDAIKTAAGDVWHFLDNIWHSIENDATTIWNDVWGFLQHVWTLIKTVFENTSIIGLLLGHWTQIKSDAEQIWGDIVSFFEGIPGKIVGAMDTLGSDIASIATTAWHDFLTAATTAWGAVASFFEGIPGKIVGFLSTIWTDAYKIGGDIIHAIVKGVEAAATGLGHILTIISSSAPKLTVGGVTLDPLHYLGGGGGGSHSSSSAAAHHAVAAAYQPHLPGAPSGGVQHSMVLNVQPGAVVIHVGSQEHATVAAAAATEGLSQLGRELQSRTAPLRTGP